MIITEKNYVEKAEAAIQLHKNKINEKTKKKKPMVTTSKIRNLLSMTADICNEVMDCKEEKLNDELCGRIDYLKVRVLYEAGREPVVREFVEDTNMLKCISEIGGSKKNYLLFSRYMEALVAYHRFYGGKDN
ncbi:type III-A CRISPR-associated protein Csm2 [Petralouisia muris]|uniref:Type III-A CRISPR-associated protein Csm2 n=1 Tax=Petralouisia muris TaxID=3032872 RepID=A0AC61RYU8_9FIRM|nr:type III-A CRISPR-associated protein Csm2 [Petralouisia muris]TGY97289.1 type III-A CRISPR-associated protein Csm2 [Petralouisia muris]